MWNEPVRAMKMIPIRIIGWNPDIEARRFILKERENDDMLVLIYTLTILCCSSGLGRHSSFIFTGKSLGRIGKLMIL